MQGGRAPQGAMDRSRVARPRARRDPRRAIQRRGWNSLRDREISTREILSMAGARSGRAD